MRILAIDPGQTSGWCWYDAETRRVIDGGTFAAHAMPSNLPFNTAACVVERTVAHGPTRPQVVECAYIGGRIVSDLMHLYKLGPVRELTRLEVRRALTNATHGTVRVKDDATAWGALKLMHGGESADVKALKDGSRFAGPLAGINSHARAACALAVALACEDKAWLESLPF